jgi:hypothetical protein
MFYPPIRIKFSLNLLLNNQKRKRKTGNQLLNQIFSKNYLIDEKPPEHGENMETKNSLRESEYAWHK